MLNKGKEKPLATPTSCVRIRGVNDPGEKPLYIQRHILPSKADDVKRRKTAQKFRGCLFFAEFRRVSPSFTEFRQVSSFYSDSGDWIGHPAKNSFLYLLTGKNSTEYPQTGARKRCQIGGYRFSFLAITTKHPGDVHSCCENQRLESLKRYTGQNGDFRYGVLIQRV
jgi:hypothetical protein